ncbi:MAG: DUF2508 family protein [Syntrophomonadaceae bacterium]|nr:DUF2508 family protein [Syntrophomonadaceae bacterium]
MRFLKTLANLFNYLLIKEEKPINIVSDEEVLENAHQELQEARNVFASIDKDFVDYAIYNLKAAEEKYNQLIKKAKEG